MMLVTWIDSQIDDAMAAAEFDFESGVEFPAPPSHLCENGKHIYWLEYERQSKIAAARFFERCFLVLVAVALLVGFGSAVLGI